MKLSSVSPSIVLYRPTSVELVEVRVAATRRIRVSDSHARLAVPLLFVDRGRLITGLRILATMPRLNMNMDEQMEGMMTGADRGACGACGACGARAPS